MKGKYRIIVENKKIKYDFEIRRNLTVIKGDSATGKTTLVDMIAEYYENGINSGIHLRCSRNCAILEGRNWETMLSAFQESILFIDEGNPFVRTPEFATAIQKTTNYYVIVSREPLPSLPYSVTEIYGIRDSQKYGTLKQTYNELYHIYGDYAPEKGVIPTLVVTEDSGAGFQFFDDICKKNDLACASASGKSNIYQLVKAQIEESSILIIADGAAFGSEMEKVYSLMRAKKELCLYLPESFEWLILKSGILKDNGVENILSEPCEYIDSNTYLSWERFFTALLVEKTKRTYLAYKKQALNTAYLEEHIKTLILKQMKGISLEKQ